MIRETNSIIKKYNVRLTKSLGQNFLVDYNIVNNIVDVGDVTKDDVIIEIGPGVGNMTKELAKRAGRVIVIEVDKHLIDPLRENLSDFSNVDIINKDILKVDIEKIVDKAGNRVKVVANLPYYITTPIIMSLLEKELPIDRMVFMVQKEVAQRMIAKEGTKEYGALTVAVNFYATAKIAFIVPASCFIPIPKVDSAVICLNLDRVPKVYVKNKGIFRKTVRAAFSQRRKILLNALTSSMGFNISKDDYREIFDKLGIEHNQRGETLNVSQFAQLSNEICERVN